MARVFPLAMFDATLTDPEIDRHEVSEDGVVWRPYDPARDDGHDLLHTRIVFAAPADEPEQS